MTADSPALRSSPRRCDARVRRATAAPSIQRSMFLPRRFSLFVFVILSLVIVHSASAAVIYSGIQNIPIPTTFDGVYVDIDNASTSTSVITGWDINPFFGGYGIAASAAFQPARIGTGNADTILNYALNDLIDGSLLYSSGETGSSDHVGGGAGQFTAGSEGYIGFKFTKNDSSGPYYGWMRVTLTVNTSGGFIHDWAWDDTGAGILVGALGIPEPSRVLLVLLGLCGIVGRRKR